MKILRQLGFCAAVFVGLLFLYVGAYLGIYKNDLGRKVFGNTYEARGVADILHRVAAHFFAPLRFLEYQLAERRLKRDLVGEWTSDSGPRNLVIHSSGEVLLKGDGDLSASGWTKWSYRGSGDYGDPAVPILFISCPDLPTALQVFPSGVNPNEIHVWRVGVRDDPERMLRRPASSGHSRSP